MTGSSDLLDHEIEHASRRVKSGFNAQNVLLAAVLVMLACLVFSSSYSTWVASHSHRAACGRTNALNQAIHDLVFDFLTPPPGTVLTAAQVAQITKFEDDTTARLAVARQGC